MNSQNRTAVILPAVGTTVPYTPASGVTKQYLVTGHGSVLTNSRGDGFVPHPTKGIGLLPVNTVVDYTVASGKIKQFTVTAHGVYLRPASGKGGEFGVDVARLGTPVEPAPLAAVQQPAVYSVAGPNGQPIQVSEAMATALGLITLAPVATQTVTAPPATAAKPSTTRQYRVNGLSVTTTVNGVVSHFPHTHSDHVATHVANLRADRFTAETPATPPVVTAPQNVLPVPAVAPKSAQTPFAAKAEAVLGIMATLTQVTNELTRLGENGIAAAVRSNYVACRTLHESLKQATAAEAAATRNNGQAVQLPNVNAAIAPAPMPAAARVTLPTPATLPKTSIEAGLGEHKVLKQTCAGLGLSTAGKSQVLRDRIDAYKAKSLLITQPVAPAMVSIDVETTKAEFLLKLATLPVSTLRALTHQSPKLLASIVA